MDKDEVMVTDKSFKTSDWYKDLVEAHSNKIPEGAITVRQFAEDTGLNEDRAREILKEKAENDDSFGSRKVILGGCRRWAFFPLEDE